MGILLYLSIHLNAIISESDIQESEYPEHYLKFIELCWFRNWFFYGISFYGILQVVTLSAILKRKASKRQENGKPYSGILVYSKTKPMNYENHKIAQGFDFLFYCN
jgi:hypothetical protein